VQTAALDSIPALRRKAMTTLLGGDEMQKAQIAEAIGYPTTTTERALEDLVAHGVVDVNRYGQGKATTWQISAWTAQNWALATSPEKSGGDISLPACTHTDDLSGEVGARGSANGNGHEHMADAELEALIDSTEEVVG
jgi:predicted ArsR family transcriptional regulator